MQRQHCNSKTQNKSQLHMQQYHRIQSRTIHQVSNGTSLTSRATLGMVISMSNWRALNEISFNLPLNQYQIENITGFNHVLESSATNSRRTSKALLYTCTVLSCYAPTPRLLCLVWPRNAAQPRSSSPPRCARTAPVSPAMCPTASRGRAAPRRASHPNATPHLRFAPLPRRCGQRLGLGWGTERVVSVGWGRKGIERNLDFPTYKLI